MSEADDDLGRLIKEKATRHEAPAHLRGRIDAMLAQQGIDMAARQPAAQPRRESPWRRWMNLSGAFAVGMAASMAFLLVTRVNPDDSLMAQAVVDSHVRSLLGEHLIDVKSSDRHTVKPWFTGKLSYAPMVVDLAPEFPLVGGRLDYLGQEPVAALVYKLNLHTVNVFIWPARGKASSGTEYFARQGFNVAHWVAGGMQYWMVSDANIGELKKIVDRIVAASQN